MKIKLTFATAVFFIIFGFWLKPGDRPSPFAQQDGYTDGSALMTSAREPAAVSNAASSATSSSLPQAMEPRNPSNIDKNKGTDVPVKDFLLNPIEVNEIYPNAEFLRGKEYIRTGNNGSPEVWKIALLKTAHRFGQLRYREVFETSESGKRLKRELIAAQSLMIGLKRGALDPMVLEDKLFKLGYRVVNKNEDQTRWTLEFDSGDLLDIDKRIANLRVYEGIAWVEAIRLHKAF